MRGGSMTQDDIIRMARQAGIAKHGLGWTCWEGQLERFAALVAAAEREKCAKVVENYTGAWDDEGYALTVAIRARKNK